MATLTARRPASSWRMLAALLAACCVVLGIAASPATASPVTASAVRPADTSLSQMTVTSVSNGFSLDDQNGTMGAGSIIVTDSTPGYDENWHLGDIAADDSFTIVNNTTGLCIDAGLPLRQQNCDGRSTEDWYFQPVAGSSSTFMIRQEGSDNCLDLWYAAPYSDAWTDSYGCNGTAAQQWTLPTASDTSALNMAVTHAASVCESNSSTCTFNATSQSPAAPLPTQCISPIWYNDTSGPVNWAFAITDTTGWSDALAIGGNVQLSGAASVVIQGKVTGEITGTNTTTFNISQTLGNTVTIPVPAGQYGWIELAELAEQVTGTWTFDQGGFPWSAPDTVTVPLVNSSTGGASVYIAKTSSTFTSCSA
jgi:hypothetical protein